MRDDRPRCRDSHQQIEDRVLVERLQLARRMQRDVFKFAEIEIRNCIDKTGELVVSQCGKLHGIDPRYVSLNLQTCREVALGECSGGKPDRFHQKTPKSRISFGNLGWTSKNRLVTPRRNL